MSHFSMPHPYSPGPLTGNDWLIWSLAIGLSLSLHVMFFLHRQPLIDRPANIIQETITHLRFAQIAPTPVQEPEPQMPKAEPQPIEPPKPVVKQQPQSQLKTKAVAEAKPVAPKKPTKHTPVKKLKPKEVKPATRVKPLNQQQPVAVQQAAVAPVNHTEQIVQGMPLATDPDKLLLEQTRKSYQAQLMRHIELHKHYPRVA